LGVDGQHRWVLSFVPGRPVAVGDFDTHLACSLGALLSEIHSVGRAFETEVRDEVPWWVRTGPELGDDEFESSRGGPVGLVHGDAGIWNVVVDQGEAALVDFECCHIGRQLWELALSALSLVDPRRVGGSIELVRALVTGYGGEVGDGWDALLVERARSAVDVIWSGASNGEEPWASMAVDGTGAWWADVERVVAHGSFTSAR
jgi:Ser/Thr protein kinase RdoA (MazF antagonist)